MDQSEQCACQTCTKKCDPAVSGGQSHNGTGERADGHHAFNTDVNNSASLREAGAKSRKKKRRSRDQGRVDQKTKVFY